MSFSFLQALCNLDFLKSKELRRTSLNRCLSYPQQPPTQDRTDPEISLSIIKQESLKTKKSFYPDLRKETEMIVKADKEKSSLTEKDFRIMQILRSGKNWRTYLVRKEGDEKTYAMKLIGKRRISKNSIEDQVAMEKEILEKAKHPFIPKLEWYFENDKKVFLVMELIEGGTLKHFLRKFTRFSEEITRFYSAEILLTLEYLHKELQTSYNGLRLRNFLIDSQGHIKLLDYSQAKRISLPESPKGQSVCGSPVSSTEKEASADEMADFWEFGCLIYELLTGRKPFSEAENTGAEEISPTSQLCWPCPVSKNAKDLITRLLNREVEKRLGFSGIEEIKKHAFFSQVNWEKQLNKSVYPPLIPSQIDNESKDYDDLEDEDLEERNILSPRASSLDRIVEGSSFLNSEDTVSLGRTTTGLSSTIGH